MRRITMSKPTKFKITKNGLEKTTDILRQIFVSRGLRVMLDSDLAKLYGVTTKRLNEQLRRNRNRFPKDFAFQLTLDEAKKLVVLRSQNATLKHGQHIKYAPHVFTEHGSIMLASVLNSPAAVAMSVYIVRAFVQMRAALAEYAEISHRLDELEEKCDHQHREIIGTIRALILPARRRPRPIGFVAAGRTRKGGA